jgi:tRNA nucleotidyltransferase/poly(A) polymerase
MMIALEEFPLGQLRLDLRLHPLGHAARLAGGATDDALLGRAMTGVRRYPERGGSP